MFKKVKKFLEDYDEFGNESNFNINRKPKFKTAIGGFLYFSVVIIFIVRFMMGFLKYINKSDPDVVISEFNTQERITFKENEEIISLVGHNAVGNKEKGNFQPTSFDILDYFNVSANLVKIKERYSFSSLDVKKCQSDNQLTKNSICVYAPKNKEIQIYESWTGESSYIIINLKFCNPEKDSKCKGMQKFFEFLKDTKFDNFFIVNIINKLYDPENFNEPLKKTYQRTYMLNSEKLVNYKIISYKSNAVESDIGGHFNIKNLVNDREIESTVNNSFYNDELNYKNIYASLLIKGLPIKRVYKRNYPFIFSWIEEAALMSGWVSVLLQFLYSFYNTYKYQWFMFKRVAHCEEDDITNIKKPIHILEKLDIRERNKNFSFEDNKSKLKEINNFNQIEDIRYNTEKIKEKKKESAIQLQDIQSEFESNRTLKLNNQNNLIEEPNLKRKLTRKDSEKVFNKFTKNIKKNDINYFTYVLSSINLKKRKLFDLFDKVCESFEKKFDVFYYLKKIKNIKLIKKLLLKEESHGLFNLASNKLYSISSITKEKEKRKIFSPEEFMKIINSIDETNEINSKLLKELLDD